jgi:predicted acyl esterase
VREIEHTWIPLSDGCRLAARIWLPEDAEEDPVPAVLEYHYRKNDGTVTTPRGLGRPCPARKRRGALR